jgi:hypothetical protein
MSRQYLNRRIPDREKMKTELDAWAARRNSLKSTVRWQFTTADGPYQTPVSISNNLDFVGY